MATKPSGAGLLWQIKSLRFTSCLLFLYGSYFCVLAPYQAFIAISIFTIEASSWAAVMFVGSLVTVLTAIAFGVVTDQRNNRRTMLCLAAASAAAAGLLVWATPSVTVFLLAHLLLLPVGASMFGQLFALARIAAAELEVEARERAMAAIRAVFALSFVFALPVWSFAFRSGLDVMSIYPMVFLLATVVLGALVLGWPQSVDDGNLAQPSGLRFVPLLQEVVAPFVLIRVALLALISAANVLFLVTIGLIFEAADGRSFSDAATFLTLVTAFEVPFMLWSGSLLARFGAVPMIGVGGVLYSAFLLLFWSGVAQAWVWWLCMPAAFATALITVAPISYLQDLLARRPGAGGALLAVNQIVGAGLAAGLFALATALSGVKFALLLGAACALIAAAALVLLERPTGTTPDTAGGP